MIRLIRGNALALPLPDACVDLVVTSPPYFGLRSYQDGGEHYAGQIGAEATPREFVDALLEATAEMMRVLKPSGSIWVNLGDKYVSSPPGNERSLANSSDHQRKGKQGYDRNWRVPPGMRQKSLMDIPHRYSIRCVDELGLIKRAEVVWSKCLSGGTRVYAEVKGRQTAIRLHDLCRAYQPEDVRLWTGDGWSQVKSWEATGRSVAQFEIELRSGERIGCTAEHRWPTQRGLVRSDGLAVGDVLRTAPLPEGSRVPVGLDDEAVGWFVGLYIAEGSRSEQTIQIAGHVKEDERFRRLLDLAQRFDGTCKVHATGGNAATINLTGAVLRGILEQYVGGKTSKDKHLLPRCWSRSNVFLRAVLDGYLSGDGSWDENLRRWSLGFTDNDALADDLRTLAARVGASLRLRRVSHYGFGQQWPGWGGTLYDDPTRRRASDSEIVAIRPSRARQFWDVEVADEPHLFALASGVLTHNSNGLPESVTDRVRRSHELWFHFTKEPRYYSAVDEIREGHAGEFLSSGVRNPRHRYADGKMPSHSAGVLGPSSPQRKDGGTLVGEARNPLGKLPGSVWTIATQPLTVPAHVGVDHFAAFPMELPRRIIQGWSPRDVCTACGEGRRPVVGRQVTNRERNAGEYAKRAVIKAGGGGGFANSTLNSTVIKDITGYACACPDTTAPTTPGVVLDSFGGTGTTALVADVLGRDAIHVDMSADYLRLARWRTTDPGQRAAAMQVEKPEPVVEGQLDMFGGAA